MSMIECSIDSVTRRTICASYHKCLSAPIYIAPFRSLPYSQDSEGA